jgi:basic membrane protein A and related proteins
VKAVGDVLDGTWKPEATKWGIKEGLVQFVKPAEFIPEPTRKKLEEARAFLVENPGAVFRGPLQDNAGKEVLPAGATADDAWKAKVNFLVKGVEGKIPSGR